MRIAAAVVLATGILVAVLLPSKVTLTGTSPSYYGRALDACGPWTPPSQWDDLGQYATWDDCMAANGGDLSSAIAGSTSYYHTQYLTIPRVLVVGGSPWDVGSVEISKSWHPRPSKGPLGPGERGPLTGPRVELDGYGAKTYARVRCRCLPAGHDEKVGLAKLGTLAVTFPERKWGRAIDVPVVTI